jgi:hypothetical protein
MSITADLINYAINKNPIEFEDAFNDILMQKAANAVSELRQEVASNVYDDEPEDDFDDELEDFDDELEDLDLDLDADLDDLEGEFDDETD